MDADVEHVRIATLPGMWERTVTLGSAGKTFSVTGWKIGWAIAPQPMAHAILMAHQWIPFTVSTPMQEAVAIGLEQAHESDYFNWLSAMYRGKRDKLLAALEASRPACHRARWFLLHSLRHQHAGRPVSRWRTARCRRLSLADQRSGRNRHSAQPVL